MTKRVTDRVDEHLSLGDYDSVRKVLRVLPNLVLVREHSGAVVESRGHFVRSLGPGFHFLSLFRREKIWNSLSTQPQMVNTPETVFESKDGNWFSSECVVTFRVIDVAKASYCREIKPWVGLSVGTFPNTMYHLKNAAYSLAYATSYFHMKTCMSSCVDESNLLLKSTEGQDQIRTILNEFLIDCGLKCELVLMVMLPSMPRKDWCESLAFANAYETDALLSAFGRDTTLVKALFEAMERYTSGEQKIMLLEELLKVAAELLQPDLLLLTLRIVAKHYHLQQRVEMKNTKR
ncbi:uncharacterized protein LOC133715143 isoform X2 [Rosa rugosa]|uniref:uncharacterized protein LOC133715143 isoform X2 n=1 Tax=Rosa rugosa TaxID=74645 RepID=UPI002B40A6CA|nr:uncharacterized protein LOC133715143 isoform X2 [Rosa rugosa]